jgi:TolA-binding protein
MKNNLIFCSLFAVFVYGIFPVQDVHSMNMSDEEQLILVGIGAFNDGFYDIAEKQFSQFIREYANHGKLYEVCFLLGRTLLIKGKLKEAKAVFLRILNESKVFEYTDYTLFWVAEIEMKLGNGEESKKFLLTIIKKFPKFEFIDYSYYLLGHLDFQSNKLKDAESSLKKISQLSKNNELIRSSLFWLGVLNFKNSDYEAAILYFQRIWEDPKFISQEYLKHALFWLGEAQLRLGRFNDAKLNYKTFYERFKNDFLIPEVYWRLGFCEYRSGNIKDSIEIFRSLKDQLKSSQLNLFTHFLLAEIYLAHGDYSSSVKELDLILNKSPQGNIFGGAALLALYWNYLHLGEMEGGSRTFQRLQKSNHFEDEKIFIQWLNAEMIFSEGKISDSLPYYFNIINTKFRERALFQIGKGYFFENKFREAITNLDILSLEFPNSKYLEEWSFIKGECLIHSGNLDQALETYDLIVRENKKNLWHLFALTQIGTINFFRNDHDKTESAFKKIIKDYPNDPLLYNAAFQLGNLFFNKNNMMEAIYYYSMVLKGNVLDLLGEAHFGLGEIFYQQGKYEKAFTNFETSARSLKENSLWFFLTQLEIGNLQRRWGNYKGAKKSYSVILSQSNDEVMKKAAKELLNHIESY